MSLRRHYREHAKPVRPVPRLFSSLLGSPVENRTPEYYSIEDLERRLLLSSTAVKFSPEQLFAAGTSSSFYFAPTDVNGDGKADVAVTDFGRFISVVLGNGNGTFQAPQTFAVGLLPTAIAPSDINGDGKIDLIVANASDGTIGVLLGNGNGTFQAQQTFTSPAPQSVVVADFNGDGRLDVVNANSNGNCINLLLGNGNGTFQAPKTFATATDPGPTAAVDVNADGKPDVVVLNLASTNVGVLLGNGNGTFQVQQTFDAGPSPNALVVSDVNGDNRPDVAIANSSLHGTVGTASVLLGNGNGTFAARRAFNAGSGSGSLAVGDLNGDGKPDLVVVNGYDSTVGVLLGNGDGTFLPQQAFHVASVPGMPAVLDLNGDGQLDILVNEGSSVGVLINRTGPAPIVLSINRTQPSSPATVDSTVQYTVMFNKPVTGVDATDFSVATSGVNYTSLSITPISGSVYKVTISGISGSGTLGLNLVDNGSIQDASGQTLQGGLASFQNPFTPQSFSTGTNPTSVAAADVNMDGRPDVLFTNVATGALPGAGDGTLFTASTFAPTGNPRSVVVADVNGDGKLDLAVTNPSTNTVSVILGNGNGTFQAPKTFACVTNPTSLAASDVNGDGKPDLVVASGNPSVSVLLGNGNGTFQSQQTFLTKASTALAVADVNGDGRPDIMVVYWNGSFSSNGNVAVLLGNGNGTFQPEQTFGVGHEPNWVTVTDVNGDGSPDLVVVNEGDENVGVLLGNGNGTFQAQRTVGIGLYYSAIAAAVADLNGDGKIDLATASNRFVGGANPYVGAVNVLEGNGDGTFSEVQGLSTSPAQITSITTSDLNGDGRPDVIVGNSAGGVSVFLNNTTGNFTGQAYTISPPAETITVSSGNATVMMNPDSGGTDIDWSMTSSGGSSNGQLPINDPRGLTINGAGGIVTINLVYVGGNPLPNTLHLNGTFTVNGLQGSNPLAATTLEIGRSTILISYSSSDPISQIKTYLKNGYNSGGWNGTPTASTGVITSIPAANNAAHTTAIGYADSADGLIAGQSANTVELKYTLYGGTTLTGTVGFNDFTRMTQHWNQTTGGTWDTGDFNYDGSVNSADFTLMTRTYNTSLGSQASPAISPVVQSPPVVQKHHQPVSKTARKHRH